MISQLFISLLTMQSFVQTMPVPGDANCLFKIFSEPNESGKSVCLSSEGQFYPDGKVIAKDKLPQFKTYLTSHPLITPLDANSNGVPVLNSFIPLQGDLVTTTGGPTWDFAIRSIQINPRAVVHVDTMDGFIAPFFGKDWNPSSLKSKLLSNLGSAKYIRVNTYVDWKPDVKREPCQVSGFFPSSSSDQISSPHQEECIPTDGTLSQRQYHSFRVSYEYDADLTLSNGQDIQLKGDTSPEYRLNMAGTLNARVKNIRRVRDGTCVLAFLQEFPGMNGGVSFFNSDCIRLSEVTSRSSYYQSLPYNTKGFAVEKGYRANIQFNNVSPISMTGDEWNLDKSRWNPSRKIVSFTVDTMNGSSNSGSTVSPFGSAVTSPAYVPPPNIPPPPVTPGPNSPPNALPPISTPAPVIVTPSSTTPAIVVVSASPTTSPSSTPTPSNTNGDSSSQNIYLGPLWNIYRASRGRAIQNGGANWGSDTVPNQPAFNGWGGLMNPVLSGVQSAQGFGNNPWGGVNPSIPVSNPGISFPENAQAGSFGTNFGGVSPINIQATGNIFPSAQQAINQGVAGAFGQPTFQQQASLPQAAQIGFTQGVQQIPQSSSSLGLMNIPNNINTAATINQAAMFNPIVPGADARVQGFIPQNTAFLTGRSTNNNNNMMPRSYAT